MDAQGLFAVFGPAFVAFGLVLARVSGLIVTTPVFSSMTIPTLVKAGMAGVISVLVVLRMGPMPALAELETFEIVLAVAAELVAGAVMGLAVTVLFAAVNFAGQLMGIQMGFAIVNVVDPVNFQQIGVLGQFLNILAMALFLAFDGHLLMLRALFESFETLPPGGLSPDGPLVLAEMVRLGARMFTYGLRIALPVSCVVLLVNVGLATIARSVPQVNVFVVGFIITISLGMIVFAFAIPSTAFLLERLVREGVESAVRLARYL